MRIPENTLLSVAVFLGVTECSRTGAGGLRALDPVQLVFIALMMSFYKAIEAL